MEQSVVNAVLEDAEQAPIPERLKAGLAIVARMTQQPEGPYDEVIARARAAGLDELGIADAANVGFHFNFINRMADALDFELPSAEQTPLLARMLDGAKRLASARRPDPRTVTDADGIVRPVGIAIGRTAAMTAPATLEPATRIAVEAFTARLRGGQRPVLEVADTLRPYLEKLARHAYRITDEDVQALFDAGYDTDAIFEITVAGAWGASVGALENLEGELARKGIAPLAGAAA